MQAGPPRRPLPLWETRIRWYLSHNGRAGVPLQWQTGRRLPRCSRCGVPHEPGTRPLSMLRPVPACVLCEVDVRAVAEAKP
jgi:hypothetical protein